MKAGVLRAGGVEIVDLPEPALSGGDIIVKMRACGLCGSDVEKVRGKYAATGRIGHEPSGVVERKSEDVLGLEVGDRVFVHHHVPCYVCSVCRSGAYTFCPEYQKTNIEPGGFAEHFRVPKENVFRGAVLKLPDNVGFNEATLIEPLGCCIDALASVPFHPGASVLVLGLGPIGTLYLRLLKASGAGRLVGGDPSPFRREVAERSGADETFDPLKPDSKVGDFDLVVVATSSGKAIADGINRTRRGGAVNMFGLPEVGTHLSTDLQELYMRGIRLIPTYATTERGTNHALKLIASGRVNVKDMVTHTFPLEELGSALAQAATTEGTIKIVVTS